MRKGTLILFLFVFSGVTYSVFGQLERIEPPPVLTPGEPEDGLKEWVVLSPSNQAAVLKARELEFCEEDVPVSIWRYKTSKSQPFMHRALTARLQIEDPETQSVLLIFSYVNSTEFQYAGVVNGSWQLGHCSLSTFHPEITSEEGKPQSGSEYDMSLEIREHDVVFRAYGTNDVMVAELKAVIPHIPHADRGCGTALFGEVNDMPVIKDFCIKRLFGRMDGVRRVRSNDEDVYSSEGAEVPQ